MPGLTYEGIHCEVGSHVVINDIVTLDSFINHINEIIKDKLTIRVL